MISLPNLVELIKMVALDAIKESKPTAILFGKVISISPLKINVEQKLTLTEAQLILTHNVVDYDLEMTVDHETDYTGGGTGDLAFDSHNHTYKGKKVFKVHNGLKVNDDVILVQMQSGQKFIVLDKVVKL